LTSQLGYIPKPTNHLTSHEKVLLKKNERTNNKKHEGWHYKQNRESWNLLWTKFNRNLHTLISSTL